MNRIFPEQLASNLNSHLAKVYFLVGTDPLLLSESEDLIHQPPFFKVLMKKIKSL